MSDTCYICGSENEHQLETHHIVPRRFGGSDDDENLVDLCSSCHTAVEKMYDARFYEQLGVQKPVDDLDATVITDRKQLKESNLYVFVGERALYRYKGHSDYQNFESLESSEANGLEFGLVDNQGHQKQQIVVDLDARKLVEVDSNVDPIKLAKRIERSDQFFESFVSLYESHITL